MKGAEGGVEMYKLEDHEVCHKIVHPKKGKETQSMIPQQYDCPKKT